MLKDDYCECLENLKRSKLGEDGPSGFQEKTWRGEAVGPEPESVDPGRLQGRGGRWRTDRT